MGRPSSSANRLPTEMALLLALTRGREPTK